MFKNAFLGKIASAFGIDFAKATVGFDFHHGVVHPVQVTGLNSMNKLKLDVD